MSLGGDQNVSSVKTVSEILVFAEGQTEETFVRDILADYFLEQGGPPVRAVTFTKEAARHPERVTSGGIVSWARARPAIAQKLKDDPDRVVTTMADYYELPDDWPGRLEPPRAQSLATADALHKQLLCDITNKNPDPTVTKRFVPFVVMHEFEGLLFSDCSILAKAVDQPDLRATFEEIRRGRDNQYQCPEDIDDDYPPSKQLIDVCPRYNKVNRGISALKRMPFQRVRNACPNFDKWIRRLEQSLA